MNFPTVPNIFTSGSTAIAANFNANYSALASGLTDGTKDLNINNLSVATSFSVVGSLNSITDISESVTISGWQPGTFTAKYLSYKKYGKMVLIYLNIAGLSNGANPYIQGLPFSVIAGFWNYNFVFTKDQNGGFNSYIGLVGGEGALTQIQIQYNSSAYVTPNGIQMSVQGQYFALIS